MFLLLRLDHKIKTHFCRALFQKELKSTTRQRFKNHPQVICTIFRALILVTNRPAFLVSQFHCVVLVIFHLYSNYSESNMQYINIIFTCSSISSNLQLSKIYPVLEHGKPLVKLSSIHAILSIRIVVLSLQFFKFMVKLNIQQ